MDVTAEAKYVRLSASKAQNLARRLRGLKADEALYVARFARGKAATLVGRALKSAIANAQNNESLAADALRVKEVAVNVGPSLRRFWARARGMASPIQKRTCHIRVVLTDGK